MGCTASKLDNEDTVRRCKDRRRLIKEAVYARHHLASAHSDYCRSLKLTASALLTFAQGESLSVSEQTPAVFLHPPPPHPRSHTPPPHLHTPPPPPFQPSPTIPSSKLPHILSSSSISFNNNSNDAINNNKSNSNKNGTNIRKFKKPHHLKLPHILSESSVSSSPKSNVFDYPTAFQSNYSNTPSQASSAWNWENFYPPSPPDSEFFNRKNSAGKFESGHDADTETETETETERSEYDFFQVKKSPPEHRRSSVVGSERNGGEMEREEVHCSEWGDHDHDRYITTSDSEMEEEDDDEVAAERAESAKEMPRVEEKEEAGSSASYRTNADVGDMKMVVRHKDLREIVEALKENFDKAAAAGDQVSEILEVGRAQLDRSFRQLKKTVYHSSSMLSNLSSSWTSKPPLAVKYRLDTVSLNQPGGLKSLCSTMERLLAWERKLYEEVKAREGVKIEHERKLATLQSQEYKGEEDAKLDKTKTSITRLNSLLVVTSQAVTTTSTAIISLRDSDLVPQLVELCHGFMYMWRAMHQFHEVQNHIVQQVRGLVNRSVKGDSTSELHRQATRDLESAVSAWHSSFCRIIKFQRDFIRSVHGWFKLTLLPVSADEINSNMERSDVYAFCDEWKLALDRVPDTVASEAIKSFINVVHAITVKQTEEHKIRKRTETASKELEKKASSLRNIERKYYQSYSMVGIGLPDTGPDNGQALDARDPLAEKKSELAACQHWVEDEMLRHAKAVEVTRAMTLNHLQTGLPGVFQALTSFSALFTEALESVCNHSYAIK